MRVYRRSDRLDLLGRPIVLTLEFLTQFIFDISRSARVIFVQAAQRGAVPVVESRVAFIARARGFFDLRPSLDDGALFSGRPCLVFPPGWIATGEADACEYVAKVHVHDAAPVALAMAATTSDFTNSPVSSVQFIPGIMSGFTA